MTPQQHYAIDHPCLLASETAHPDYRKLHPSGLSIIVTVNAGYE